MTSGTPSAAGPSRPRTVVVTGASSGIGLAAAVELGRRGWEVALLGRDARRLDEATARVAAVATAQPRGFRCDFTSFAQVRAVAAQLREAYPVIDVLVNNAGGHVPQRRRTEDGYEETIQANHLAHFLLTHELRDVLSGGRVINTSSRVHAQGRLDPDDLNSTARRFVPLRIYASAKQANVLFAVEATKRWPDILSTSLHPGVIRTRFGREKWFYRVFYQHMPLFRAPEYGAKTIIYLAEAPASELQPGGYYMNQRLARAAPRATDPELARRLWEASARAVGL